MKILYQPGERFICNSYITGRRDVLDLLTSPSSATRPHAWSINPIHPDYPVL